MSIDLIKPNTRWIHRNGNFYRVICVSNQHADDTERYPLMVTYVDVLGRHWSKPADRFLAGMALVEG